MDTMTAAATAPAVTGHLGVRHRMPATGWPVLLGTAAALVVLDLAVVLADIGHRAGLGSFSSSRWDLEREAGHAEVLGSGQLVVAGVLLALLALRHRGSPVLAAWAVVLAAVVVDDLRAVHERGGRLLVDGLGLPALPGLRPQDVGELLVWLALACALGSLLLVTARRSSRPARAAAAWVLGGVAVLGAFAIGFDALHSAVEPALSERLNRGLVMAEAAGEALASTVVLVVVLRLVLAGLPERGPVAALRTPRPVRGSHRAPRHGATALSG